MIRRAAKKFLGERRGTILIKFALALPAVLMITVGGMDYAWTVTHKSVIQDAADVAALAGAKELSLADAKRENVAAMVEDMARHFIENNRSNLIRKQAAAPIVKATITDKPLEVAVEIKQKVEPLAGGDIGLEFPPIKVRSVARVIGQPNICVLALEPSDNNAISLEQRARVTGKDCAVFSNSSHSLSLAAKESVELRASFICTVGGVQGNNAHYNPSPVTDCPTFEDPLNSRIEESPGSCKETGLVIDGGSRTLSPGTYCGGIHITNGAYVSLTSGTYYFQDGPLRVDGNAMLNGQNVGLFFGPSASSVLDFDRESSIRLTAGKSGGMAGMLVFASRTQPEGTEHRLFSNDAPELVGTIYIPNGKLKVDAESPIADESAYTAIVARKIQLFGGPHLVLNTDYDKTDVPVPEGIKGAGQPVRLVE